MFHDDATVAFPATIPTADDPPGGPLAAGSFADWVDEMTDALDGFRPSDVPCGSCTACCTSSQFVPIGPDETDTLARIPRAMRVPAPGLPPGHWLLGYDQRGHCPMLGSGRCSIYDYRPRACRTYDCRIFAAAGVAMEGEAAPVARQARRWRFGFLTPRDRAVKEAVGAAVGFLRAHPEALPEGRAPVRPAQLAVLAVAAHEAFLHRDPESRRLSVVAPDPAAVRARLTSWMRPPRSG